MQLSAGSLEESDVIVLLGLVGTVRALLVTEDAPPHAVRAIRHSLHLGDAVLMDAEPTELVEALDALALRLHGSLR